MSRVCQLTGKKTIVGNNVSHSNQKTKRRLHVNLQDKTFYIPELKRSVRLRVSARAIKTINKKGLFVMLQELKKKGINVL